METTKKIKRVNKDEPTGFDRFNRVSKGANAVLNIIFIIMSLLCVIPILLVVAISFSAEDSITEYGYRFIPKIFSLEGYTFLASQSTMLLRALGVSLFVTIVGTVLGVMLTTLMGYVLSRPNYKLNGFLTMVVFIPMVFNGGLVSTYFVVSQLLGLKNTIWALIPLPVLATIGLFLCFAYWNDWYQSMLYIDNTKLLSLQALLNQILTNIQMLVQNAATLGASAAEMLAKMPKEAARMSIVVIIVLPIACAYPFFQQYFISGLTVGAVKG